MAEHLNPPAFPQHCADALDVGMVHEGMTLRDWFAGQALPIIIQEGRPTEGTGTTFDWMAQDAYRFADAMLAERAKGGEA